MPRKGLEKGVEFEEGKKDLSSKGLFPLLNYPSLQIIEPVALLEDFGRPTGVFFEER